MADRGRISSEGLTNEHLASLTSLLSDPLLNIPVRARHAFAVEPQLALVLIGIFRDRYLLEPAEVS